VKLQPGANVLDGRPLTELTKIGGSEPLPGKDLKADVTGLSLESLKSLVFNVLLLLTHYDLEPIITEAPALVRAVKVEGTHLRPELVRARFLSQLVRPRTIKPALIREDDEMGADNDRDTFKGSSRGTGIEL
jgi:hypothetical protein